MKCDALWVTGFKQIEVRETDVPDPGYYDVQVETKACGVCCWDSYQYQGLSGPGPYPYIIGHEAAGIVKKVGVGVKKWKVGDKVTCASGSIVEMCQYFNIPENCLVPIPDDTEDYVPWVIEPTVTVVNVLKWANIEPGEHVVLIGAGYMGQLTLMGLTRAFPCGKITVFEKREDRLEMARAYGPCAAYNPESAEGKAVIDELVKNGGVDNIIEFSASDDGFALANLLAGRSYAKLTVGSWHRHDMTFEGTRWHMSGFIVNNISPSATRHYEDLIPRTAALINRGVFEPGKLVTHVAHYTDCKAVFDRSVDKQDGYIKGVVLF